MKVEGSLSPFRDSCGFSGIPCHTTSSAVDPAIANGVGVVRCDAFDTKYGQQWSARPDVG